MGEGVWLDAASLTPLPQPSRTCHCRTEPFVENSNRTRDPSWGGCGAGGMSGHCGGPRHLPMRMPLALLTLLLQLVLLHDLARPRSAGAAASGADSEPELLPTSGPELTALGSKHLDAGRVPEALAAFRRAARLFPGVSLAHYNHGIAASRAGELEESAAACAPARPLAPPLRERNLISAGRVTRRGGSRGADQASSRLLCAPCLSGPGGH